jgi:hypothetical protein
MTIAVERRHEEHLLRQHTRAKHIAIANNCAAAQLVRH